MAAYQEYLDELRGLLHDANDQFWSETEKKGYINDARNRVVRDTGCYRVLQGGYLSQNNEKYAFGGVTGVGITTAGTGYSNSFAVTFTGGGGSGATGTATAISGAISYVIITNQGSGYTSNPTPVFTAGGGSGGAGTAGIIMQDTFDIVNLTIYWGASRLALSRLDWSGYNARARYYVDYIGRPVVFALYSANSVYMQRIPDQSYQCEWDSVVKPPVLVDDTTPEVIPFPFRTPVAYYAAYKAKIKEQSWGESDKFMDVYKHQVMDALRSTLTRSTFNPYAG